MTPQPIIGDTTFSTEHRGLVRKVLRYHARIPITWDEFTEIAVDVSEPADLHKGQSPDDRFKAIGKRCARLAEIVANAGNMVNELAIIKAELADQTRRAEDAEGALTELRELCGADCAKTDAKRGHSSTSDADLNP